MTDGNNKSILKMITGASKDMRKGKRRANRAWLKNKRPQDGEQPEYSGDSGYISTDSESVCSSEGSFEWTSESIQRLSSISHQLQKDILSSLNTYVTKEVSLSKALHFHMDRAMGRFDSGNTKGSLLSIRKLKSLKQEYDYVDGAVQFFSVRKVELDRFIGDLQTHSLDDNSDESATNLQEQAVHICSKINVGTLEQILVPSNAKDITDEEMLDEIKEHLERTGKYQPEDDAYNGLYDDDEDDTEDDTAFSLSDEDKDLVRDILALKAASPSSPMISVA